MKITNQRTPNFPSEKKVYSHLFTSPFSDRFKPSISSFTSEKKIVVTTVHSGLRDEFKKMFLPLLIDIFELRQLIDTYKLQKQSPTFHHLGKASKTPEEIMMKLREMQADIEESQRWCNGVIQQIAKGIQEAQETFDYAQKQNLHLEETLNRKSKFSFNQLINRIKGLLWKKK